MSLETPLYTWLIMDDFEFYNPVRIIFGRSKIDQAGSVARDIARRVLVCSGRGSARRSGSLQRLLGSLQRYGVEYVELSGIQSNPLLGKVRDGIELVGKHNLDGVVALGGGSVMDTGKAIAAGSCLKSGDIWDCFRHGREISRAIPLVAVPTLAASGSEMNGFMVITNEAENLKLAAGSPHVFPCCSILDPELTFSVPPDYTAYGAVDAVSHLLEPFFNRSWPDTPVQDGVTYGLIRAIVSESVKCLEKPDDYHARANLMWGATLALNGLAKSGIGDHNFPVHMIEHSLSALFNVPHGAGLAALFPGWIRWFASCGNLSRVAELARNMGWAPARTPDSGAATAASEGFAQWFREIKCPVCLADLSISEREHRAIVENAMVQARIWGIETQYNQDVILQILEECQVL